MQILIQCKIYKTLYRSESAVPERLRLFIKSIKGVTSRFYVVCDLFNSVFHSDIRTYKQNNSIGWFCIILKKRTEVNRTAFCRVRLKAFQFALRFVRCINDKKAPHTAQRNTELNEICTYLQE